MSQQPYNTDGYGERGPQLLSDPTSLTICRPVGSVYEMTEFGAAVAMLHVGNVVRQVLRPLESHLNVLGRLGMSAGQRPIIDYRPGKMPL